MGAHTLGTLVRENSGYNGVNGWLGNTRQFGNGYYNDLVGEFSITVIGVHKLNFEANIVCFYRITNIFL